MDNTFKSPVVLSFCPGILGIERGLARAGTNCRVAAYVEIEAFICANLVAGMEAGILDPAPIWTDAKTFDARPFRGRIHGIIGGYPCPGESLAGLREGHLYKGFIWPAIRGAIAAARPIFCFFENVDDHLTGTYPIVQRSLRNMGYAVEAGVYSAEEVGAPHERKRLFILAISNAYIRSSNAGNESTRRETRSDLNWSGKTTALANMPKPREWQLSECEPGQKWDKQGDCFNIDRVGKKMVHSIHAGCREHGGGGITVQEKITGDKHSGFNEWPAGQGENQYEWEHTRTIKPGMGCTINGYNFREDILRALGNSVVEQTAELAWKDLLRKHF